MLKFSSHFRAPDFNGFDSFNLGVGGFGFQLFVPNPFNRMGPALLYLNTPVWLYNLFRRVYETGPEYGAGLLQIGGRHLLGVISNEEEFKIDVLWMHVVSEKRSNG